MDVLPLGEVDAHQLAREMRLHFDGGIRFHLADGAHGQRHSLLFHGRNRDWHRGRRSALCLLGGTAGQAGEGQAEQE